MNLPVKVVTGIFANQKAGTTISTNDYTQILVWRREIMPILKKLEAKHYLNIRYGRKNITFKILNHIDEDVVKECC